MSYIDGFAVPVPRDNMMLAATLDAVPGVRNGRGQPRRRLFKLYADKA